MTEYRIFFADRRTSNVNAAKVYFGWKRFYLYDEANNVVGCFSWEQLSGFQTVSDPVQQIILQDHDDLPHNRKSKAEDKEESLKKQKGEFLYEIENLIEQLRQVSSRLSDVWLTVNSYRRSKTTELTVLLDHSRGDVQKAQARLADMHKDFDKRLRQVLEDIGRALKGDFNL